MSAGQRVSVPALEPLALIVDDDVALGESCADMLEAYGFRSVVLESWQALLDALRGERPAVILLDQLLGGVDAVFRLTELRRRTAAPIIVVTANRSLSDRILALERGADDVLLKPVSGRELVARARAALRRDADAVAPPWLTLSADGGHAVTPPDRRIPLTPGEAVLLGRLCAAPGTPVEGATLTAALRAAGIEDPLSQVAGGLIRKLHVAGLGTALRPTPRSGFELRQTRL